MLLWNKFTWFFHFSRNILFAIIHVHALALFSAIWYILTVSSYFSVSLYMCSTCNHRRKRMENDKKETNIRQHVKLTRKMLYNILLEWKCLPSEYIHCVWILYKYGINYYQKLNFELINKHNIPSSGMSRKICHAKLTGCWMQSEYTVKLGAEQQITQC